jgi:hypothetical protein
MNGVWIARQTTFSRDSVFNAIQTASSWSYYEISQSGRNVTVTAAMSCGIQVSGSAQVTISRAGTAALAKHTEEAGRRGLFYKEGDHCVFSLERHYQVRGCASAVYLPASVSTNPDLDAILPALPTAQAPSGAEDWDGDGSPGIAFIVASMGTRNAVQRDWNEMASDTTYKVALGSTEFVVAESFDDRDSIMATSGFGALLQAGAVPAAGLRHRAKFRRLGLTPSDAAVKAIHAAADVDTCYNIQDALPHDPASL